MPLQPSLDAPCCILAAAILLRNGIDHCSLAVGKTAKFAKPVA
jgi:hypothetical protein